jgi:hypothetical protein
VFTLSDWWKNIYLSNVCIELVYLNQDKTDNGYLVFVNTGKKKEEKERCEKE